MFLAINEQMLPYFQALARAPGYRQIKDALGQFVKELGAPRIHLAPHLLLFDAAEYL